LIIPCWWSWWNLWLVIPCWWRLLINPLVLVISNHVKIWLVKLEIKVRFLGCLDNLFLNFIYCLILIVLKHIHVHRKIEAWELLNVLDGLCLWLLNYLRPLNLFLLPFFLNLLENLFSFLIFCFKLL
jgi:hypothetical protein